MRNKHTKQKCTPSKFVKNKTIVTTQINTKIKFLKYKIKNKIKRVLQQRKLFENGKIKQIKNKKLDTKRKRERERERERERVEILVCFCFSC